ncbi:PREDICTED: V-type proton ATPase subunit G 3 [Dipodomys ordii]|uniref:V-type proton ATPase subunit G n=1 Tax=Dipodomys ordii TaxID=10020 RepID=A0A1S3F849_DIPOR|nr:PREDICTED: V-type proton ATPase subunit G 3 [Dipodomys ordii]
MSGILHFPDCTGTTDSARRTMASQCQGIQPLLQADRRAKDKLEDAKKRKVKRLKQAKEEAMAETDQYKMQRDEQFRLKQSKIMGSQGDLASEIEEQTQGNIQELNRSYNQCMESVMKQLLSAVCDMKPEVHVNYRLKATS